MNKRKWWLASAALLAGLIMLAPVLARCQENTADGAADAEPETSAEDNATVSTVVAPAIVLAKNLRLLIRPTLLGLVPPPDGEGYGEAFIRVTAAGPGELALHYEIKELVDSADGQASEWWQAAPEGAKPETRIRRGEINVAGLADACEMYSPLLWGNGDFTTQSSLLWLSRACYTELTAAGSAQFNGHSAAEASTPLAELLAGLVAERRAQAQLPEGEPARLELIRRGSYPCEVNGARVRLPALLARDGAGLAEYWILDDADNPLVLKLSYLPSANTEDEVVEAETAPSASTSSDSRRPKLKIGGSVYTPRQPSTTPPETAEPGSGLAALVREGGGYAVTAINF